MTLGTTKISILPILLSVIIVLGSATIIMRLQRDAAKQEAKTTKGVVVTVQKGAEAAREAQERLKRMDVDQALRERGWLEESPAHSKSPAVDHLIATSVPPPVTPPPATPPLEPVPLTPPPTPVDPEIPQVLPPAPDAVPRDRGPIKRRLTPPRNEREAGDKMSPALRRALRTLRNDFEEARQWPTNAFAGQ